MKIHAYFLLTIVVCLIQVIPSRANTTADTLYASGIRPYGRYKINDRNELELISSAVHFGITFSGRQCAVFASNRDEHAHNYIQYELDGVYQRRLRIDGHPTGPIIIPAGGNGPHTIWIYKATEAHTGPVIISKLVADNVSPVSVATAPLIEFIGNSITCGAAADTTDYPCSVGEYNDYHNAYMAYGPRVARALGVNYMLSSVSGIGIYRTWNADGPSMPQVYENIDFQLNNPDKWDFSKYSPKIVSIALGTNDLSNGDGKTPRKPFDKEVFIADYVGFVKLVKTKYPKAQIVLLNSPMVKGTAGDILKDCLLAIKSQVDAAYPSDKAVQLFFFSPMEPHGCYGHPSVEDHKILAAELQPFFRKLLSQAAQTIFFDDFNTGQLDRSKWNVVVTGFHVNNELQAYVDSAKTLFEEDGQLVFQPDYTPGFVTRDGQHFDFISARINTKDKFDFLYGRAEARIRIDNGAGLWPAWWMLGYGDWPACGEQDIMEFVGEHDWASAAVHGPKYFGNTPFVNRYYFPADQDITQWHIYTVDWTPDSLNFSYDGHPMFRVTRDMTSHYGHWVFDKKEFLILNFALGGAYPAKVNAVTKPYNGLPESTVELIKQRKVKMYVDWVKVTQNP